MHDRRERSALARGAGIKTVRGLAPDNHRRRISTASLRA
jgi:hypothetical protein